MRRLFTALLFLGCIVSSTVADPLTATLTIKNFALVGSTYSFDIYGLRTNATDSIFVGISSFFINYNSSGLSTPTLTNVNASYSANSNYSAMTVAIVGGKIAVTVNRTGIGHSLSAIGPDGDRFCTVNLTVTNAALSSGMSWDDVNSAISTTNSQPVTQTFAGSDNSPLPVQLALFTAGILTASQVQLHWQTASETNNYGFEVERSGSATTGFQTLAGSFQAGHGTTTDPHDYNWTDNNATTAEPWYRLKQIDLDQTAHYSEALKAGTIASVKDHAAIGFQLLQNYPNPFNHETNIKFSVQNTGLASLKIYSIIGQEVATLFDGTAEAGRFYSVTLNGRSLASGVYIYRLISGNKTDIKRLVLVK